MAIVVCPECGGTAHRLGDGIRNSDGDRIAARYICHAMDENGNRDMCDLEEIGSGDPSRVDGYIKGQFCVDLRDTRPGEVEYISRDRFGQIVRRYG